MAEFLAALITWINGTQVLDQIRDVDANNLFKNTYFLLPFISLIIYYLYKQAFNKLGVMAICIGLWYFTGTAYVKEAVVDGQLNLSKILPLIVVGFGGVGSLIYLLVIKSD